MLFSGLFTKIILYVDHKICILILTLGRHGESCCLSISQDFFINLSTKFKEFSKTPDGLTKLFLRPQSGHIQRPKWKESGS